MALLLLQVVIVLTAAHLCGWVAQKVGQARVIGQMVGWILLGPSGAGRLIPHFTEYVFPPSRVGSLEVLSNIGLIFYLFVIGASLEPSSSRRHQSTAGLASALSIVLPFGMSVAVAPAVWKTFGSSTSTLVPFALFLGTCMSITAFPVLARILEETELQFTSVGSLAIMCAAFDDVTGWILLTIALALTHAKGGFLPIGYNLGLLALYGATMMFVVRPAARRLLSRTKANPASKHYFAVTFIVVFASAAATDALGVHPLIGAFIAGVCFPRLEGWRESMADQTGRVVTELLLPLFFALTGLRTRIDLFGGYKDWLWVLFFLLIATVGKMGGAILAARLSRLPWRFAFILGMLLNTRGLVELVVLNLAYESGIISQSLFTILVVVAVVTTLMTVPCVNWLRLRHEEIAVGSPDHFPA